MQFQRQPRKLSRSSAIRIGATLRAGIISAGTAFAVLAIGTGHAQTVAPSRVTPSDLRPAPSSSASITLPSAPGLVAPPNAGALSLNLGGVVVDGGFDDLKSQTDAIINGMVGKKITVADLYDAASALESAYAAAGYILVRVVVPPQKLSPHGRLRLIVVDGFIETVDVKGVPDSQRALVTARMAPLIGRRHMKRAEIERRVLLASDDPGLTLRSTLAPGADSGATKLVLEGAHKPVTGSIGIDNDLPRSLGRWAYNAGLQLNSVFGQGEQIYATASTGYDLDRAFNGASPLQIFGGGFTLPVGIDGFTINPEYTNSITRPDPPAGAPLAVGYFQRGDLRASYPVIRTRNETLIVSSIVEWDEEYLTPVGFGANLYDDRYFVERLSADDLTSFSGGAAAHATGVLSQGLGGRTGAGAIVPLSQAGASPDFTKLNLTLRWTQPLPQIFNLALIGSGQTSFGRPLMISEQFALDGPDAVSGFPTGTFIVDEGALLRAELGRVVSVQMFDSSLGLAPYVFGAGGRGFIDQPTAVQQATIDAGSLGLGIRTSINPNSVPIGAALGLEVARYYSDVPNEREGWRGNLSFSVRF